MAPMPKTRKPVGSGTWGMAEAVRFIVCVNHRV
jgi:hypothetical protein